jgi:hypothetical protein
MRILIDSLLGVGDAHHLEQFDRAIAGLAFVHPHVELERFADLPVDGQDRIQGRHRVLKDHGDVIATDGTNLLIRHAQDVIAIEEDLARHDLTGRARDEAHDRQTGHALAAARLPDDAERLPGHHMERNVINGLDDAVLSLELCLQAANFEDRTAPTVLFRLGAGTASRPLPCDHGCSSRSPARWPWTLRRILLPL